LRWFLFILPSRWEFGKWKEKPGFHQNEAGFILNKKVSFGGIVLLRQEKFRQDYLNRTISTGEIQTGLSQQEKFRQDYLNRTISTGEIQTGLSQQDYLNRRNSDRTGKGKQGVLFLNTLIALRNSVPTGKDVLRFLHPGRTGFSRGGGFAVVT